MQRATTNYPISVGDVVVSSDDETIGTVMATKGEYLHVEKGFIFQKDFYVPMSAIAGYDKDEAKIRLNMTKDEVTSSGWDFAAPVFDETVG
jgi:hypothetical protein